MKGTVNAAELAAAIKTAQTIVVSATKIDALKYVRLTAKDGTLEIESTNLDQHMAVRVDTALSDGVVIVDPARLVMALQPIKGDATISCANGFMSISGKGSRSRLATPPSDMWADVERPKAENSFDVDGESFLAALETLVPAVADGADRVMLTGAHLKWEGSKLIAEAADGALLLTREIVARQPKRWPQVSVIIPREFMQAAGKIMKGDSATLSITESRIVLTTSVGWLASKLIASIYPDISRVWDKDAAPALRADRKSLLSVVKLANQFAEGGKAMVMHNGEVLAAGPNGEMFRAAFECEYIKDQTYCFQPKPFTEGLSALTSETVDLTDGGSKPHTITIQGDGARLCAVAQITPPAWWRREMAAEKAEAA